MDDPKSKKKDIWAKITSDMAEANYHISQSKIESKWRSLMRSHKQIRDNKSSTGSKRKTFQYYDAIEEIMSKRHDINPPLILGSGCISNISTNYSTRNVCHTSLPVCDDDDTDPEVGRQSTEIKDKCDTVAPDPADAATSTKKTATSLTASAAKRREQRKQARGNDDVLTFLQKMDKQRQKDHEEREANKDRRASDRNDLLRQFLDVLKK
jgi:hypothetical protein